MTVRSLVIHIPCVLTSSAKTRCIPDRRRRAVRTHTINESAAGDGPTTSRERARRRPRDCSALRVSRCRCCSNCSATCNQSCGHQQVDMLSLLLGRSRPGRQLVKVFSASLVRIVRDDTSRLVAAPRQDALQAWTYHWTCCHGETIADRPCCGHVRGTDTAARCKGTDIGSIVAGRPSCGSGIWVAGRSDSFGPYTGFWRQMHNQRTATSSMRKAGLHITNAYG